MGDAGDADCARCGAPMRGPAQASPPPPAPLRAALTAHAVAQATARAAFSAERRRRDLMDVAGGAVVYAGTCLFFFGVPASAGHWLILLATTVIGAVAGALSAWQRGGLNLLIWGGAAIVDWGLLFGFAGLWRFLSTAILGQAIGFTRRMDRMEGL